MGSTLSAVVDQWWTEANNIYEFAAANPEQFQAVVNKAPDAIFQPLWNFCSGSDGAVNGAELATCGQTIGNFVGMSGDNQNFLYIRQQVLGRCRPPYRRFP